MLTYDESDLQSSETGSLCLRFVSKDIVLPVGSCAFSQYSTEGGKGGDGPTVLKVTDLVGGEMRLFLLLINKENVK